ncbi:MAG: hypothetical protein WBW92_11710, partial [Rhodanobacteraceae bacterium]
MSYVTHIHQHYYDDYHHTGGVVRARLDFSRTRPLPEAGCGPEVQPVRKARSRSQGYKETGMQHPDDIAVNPSPPES